MNEYPDYYPPIMRDFHDQKDLFKAFYIWLEMLDNKRNQEKPRQKPMNRTESCSWIDFHILTLTFFDFLFQHGWQLYRTRRKGEYPDIDKSVTDLLDLRLAWASLVDDEFQLLRREKVDEIMGKWRGWLQWMPPEVQERWGGT